MDEDEPGFGSGGTAGGRLGCLAAFLFAFVLSGALLIGLTLGDCAPDVACHAGDDPVLLRALALSVAAAALAGLAVRAAANRIWPRLREKLGAIGAAILLGAIILPASAAAGWYAFVLLVNLGVPL
jgi:hypothetical protein